MLDCCKIIVCLNAMQIYHTFIEIENWQVNHLKIRQALVMLYYGEKMRKVLHHLQSILPYSAQLLL